MNPLKSSWLACLIATAGSVAWHAEAQTGTSIADEVAAYCRSLPFTMPKVDIAHFPAARFDIRAYGAVADGRTTNTAAITAAITACADAGGGIINVPPGTWLTGPIELRSNCCLNLEQGALLQFSSRLDDFPLVARDEDTLRGYIVASPISAHDAHNIGITGRGVIDGAGEAWRYVLREKQTANEWKSLIASGGVVTTDGSQWWPSRDALEGEQYLKNLHATYPHPAKELFEKAKRFLRPDLVRFERCTSVLLDGPTFRNSPRYHLHPIQSDDIVIRDVSVLTPWFAMNGDGIDLSACRRVVVYRSMLDVGDDGICLKPSSPSSTQGPGPSCSQILIADCTVYRAHGGFVIGSESFGGVKDVAVRNCIFIGTDVGVRFKSARGRGGLVEDVSIEGVQMRAIVNEAILFDMYYSGGAPEVESTKDRSVRAAEPVTPRTPKFRNFTVRNVVCNGAARAILLNGLPEVPITNIEFDSVIVTAGKGVTCIDANAVRFNGCTILAREGPAVTVNAGSSIVFTGGTYRSSNGCLIRAEGVATTNIRFDGVDVDGGSQTVEVGAGASPNAVLINPIHK